MEEPADLVDRFEAHLRRRMRIVLTLMAVGFVLVAAILVVLPTASPRGFPIWVFVYLAIAMPSGFAAFAWIFRRSSSRLVRFLRILRPRVVDAALARGANPLFLFDNGLLAAPVASNLWVWLYATPAGSPATPRNAVEAAQMGRRSWRMRKGGAVTSSRGPEPARQRLLEIEHRLECKRAIAILRELPDSALPDPRAPTWSASFTCMDPKWMEKGERWLDELDDLRDFLERLRTEYFPPNSQVLR